ncbi:putative tRNA(His) guanylyltransferase [Papilio xuthus]|uniref:tRNA(His) guanylyltransferase n=1 Tax=Papilio xuthus TaxID=66420 RepID=A0A194PLX5_PAPXU|nr:putative tRNA(His) guanylyltransferase [Papilio xuthus]
MAKSSFEYVKKFELDDTLLPNTWIVVRLDGKCFHKFADDHNFKKPNDLRALKLMNYAAFSVMRDFSDLLMGFGQSDEYSFVFKKDCNLYKRRAAKLLTTITSKFSTSYTYYWNKFLGDQQLLYPPSFDGRIVLYPNEDTLIDYMKWRQADVHINNLYNTTFWTLVQEGKLSPTQASFNCYVITLNKGHSFNFYILFQAEKRLCGTVSADKNEILFKEFNINYNNELEIFKRGTLLFRKNINIDESNKCSTVIVDVHDDMLKDSFWKDHKDLFTIKSKQHFIYNGPMTEIISAQLHGRKSVIPETT